MAKEAKKQEKKEKKGGKAAGIGIIAALLLLGGGLGYSTFGTGNGGGADTSGPKTEATQQQSADRNTPDADNSAAADQGQAEIPQTIVVKIVESNVTINGETAADKEALKNYINLYNSDTRTFVLEEENSIKEQHDWVIEAFNELGVKLTTK